MKNFFNFQHFVGCDVSKDTLDFALYARDTNMRSFPHIRVSNSPDGFKQMCKWLKTNKVKIKGCVVAMEHTGIYSQPLSQWCHKKKLAFVFLNPLDVKNACTTGRHKTDRDDACFIADYVYTNREKLKPSEPTPPVIDKLRELRNERTLAVKTRTAYRNHLATMTDPASRERMEQLIKELSAQIRKIEKDIEATMKSEESLGRNYKLLMTIPGIGMINSLQTIIATANFIRFQTARQYAKFCCVSPLSKESGKTIRCGDHVVKKGHNEIKACLTEGARSAVIKDPGIAAYYKRKRAEGKSHGTVMNAVKFKLICRMFAVINRQQPYVDTDKYRSK